MVNKPLIDMEPKTARYLKFLARKLLRVIEKRLTLFTYPTSADMEYITKTHHWLFGSKVSLVDALIKTTDLMLRLYRYFPDAGARTCEKCKAHPFSPINTAPVEDSVAKQESQPDLSKE